jgi:hypothetical protein
MPHLEHPYEQLEQTLALRGNLHAHTTRSDGGQDLAAVVEGYRRIGHDFLMIADHDLLSSEQDYHRVAHEAPTMLLIPGNEVSANGPHLLHVGADRRLDPEADRQRVLDAAAAGRGFVVVNHPNLGRWFDHCPIEQLLRWRGYVGIEIYNAVSSVLSGDAYALDKWDMVLSAGRRIWGFANDDSHGATQIGLGWNVVYAADRTVSALLEALVAGRFYATTGITIDRVVVDGMSVAVEAAEAERIVAITRNGRRVATVDGPRLAVDVLPQWSYVRFECWGRGERFAWTQPFFARG